MDRINFKIHIKYLMFVLVASIIVISIVFKVEMGYWFNLKMKNYITEQNRLGIGEKIGENLVGIDEQGDSIRIVDIIKENTLVMVYSAECTPCNNVINMIMKTMQENRALSKQFLVLGFSEKMPYTALRKFKIKTLNVKQERSNTIFDGLLTPTFYEFNSSGILILKETGWTENFLNKHLFTESNNGMSSISNSS